MIFVPYFIGERARDGARLADGELLEPTLPDASPLERMGVLYAGLADRVAAGAEARVQAGDCVAALGVVAGLQRRGIDPHVVWLDAHGDFNTWETSPSGFLGGMPLPRLPGAGRPDGGGGAGRPRPPVRDRPRCRHGVRGLEPRPAGGGPRQAGRRRPGRRPARARYEMSRIVRG